MFVLAGYLSGQVLDGLMRVQGTVQHIEFLLQDCKVAAIRTVLNMQDGILVVLDLLDHAGVLDVEDAQHSRLETCSEEEALRVGGETQAVIVGWVAELVGLL